MPEFTRRNFLQTTAAAVAAPTIVSSAAFASQGRPAPSDRVVIGVVGTGDLGRRHHLAHLWLPNKRVEVAAVCDVDRNHRDEAARDVQSRNSGKRIGVYSDFRDLCDRTDLDAVVCVTPDHWHTLVTKYAMETGKDVYCEKPLTLTIEEGKHLVSTARRYGTVFQVGSQQRSDGSLRFQKAVMLARSGKLGKLSKIETWIGDIDAGNWQAPTTPPSELDWNMWLGPAPYADYFPARCHYQFRWFSDYSGGKLTDWGAHHNDIAQWALNMDSSGPVKVKGTGKFHENGPHDVASDFHVIYTYKTPTGEVELHCFANDHSEMRSASRRTGNGVRITGSDGWVFVNREKIEASNPELLKIEPSTGDADMKIVRDHYNHWLDCIQSRERPICDVEVGHRSATVCHLGNIAVKLGRELTWDPAKEQFVGDDQANGMVDRPKRAPWHL